MKFFICILLLSVLCGLHTLGIEHVDVDEHRDKILDLLDVSSYHLIELNDELSANEDLVRVRRSPNKLMKMGCERDLALASTFGGGGVGAGAGALTGAAIGSVVPILGTAVGAFTGVTYISYLNDIPMFFFS